MENGETVDFHLQQALFHLEKAIDQSIESVLQQQTDQKEISRKWEYFLGHFLHLIREKGKARRINLLSWINFSRLLHFK